MRAGATRAADRVALSDAPGYDLRKVHGEQDIFFLKPIVPKMVLYSRVAPIGVEVRSSGTTITAKSETRDQRDEMVNYQYWTVFYRGVYAPMKAGHPAPARPVPPSEPRRDPVAVRVYSVDGDQPVRYAAASGDRGPYHLDESAAKAAGFPGVILHGLCTMAFASRALVETVCAGDSTRLRRFGLRFTQPAFPGRDLATSIWSIEQQPQRSVYTVEVAQGTDPPVIRLAIAEVGS
jgi:acyl dehydratase